ncbi:family 20 glycosylhydrolase [Parapedobacter lycopersici]|uniref:family 20 glycosylhydrolase n=1 Tax=Parapedobacter lycopersici TaxID=1864939 RepID=UPI00214D9CBB|nr:family 20 glycosylhydrolase [Parapedobacter lycopersici]
MMVHRLFFSLLSTVLLLSSCASQSETENRNILAIEWEVAEVRHAGGNETLSLLTIKNTSADTLHGAGWAIYFNGFGGQVSGADSAVAKIERVNGDFFTLQPLAGWRSLPPDSAIQLHILTRILRNMTDVPTGFYLVSERHPEGIDLPFSVKPYPQADSLEMELAKRTFIQNERIIDLPQEELPPVLPTPLDYTLTSDTFKLNASAIIIPDAGFGQEAGYLQAELAKVLTTAPGLGEKAGGGGAIHIRQKEMPEEEGYELTIDASGVRIEAATPVGAFYGIQSLKQLIPPQLWKAKQSAISLPGVRITDAPRFGHRAVMLDVARNFQSKEQVLKILDLLSAYKVNVMHFHLNEDEAWRLEIPGLPELTEVGSQRGHTLDDAQHLMPSYGSGPGTTNAAGSGFYSRSEFIDILRYATARHIRVIPEIETPGHARAAIKSMDARYARYMAKGDTAAAKQYLLRDLDDRSEYRSVQHWNDNVINVALPSTYAFLEKVTDELMAMYTEAGAPLQTIHFGGDEVPAGVWEKSPAARQLIAGSDVKNIDELWHYYFGHINRMLKSRGLYLSGWEEIGMKKAMVNGRSRMVVEPRFAGEHFHVDVWNNLGGNMDLAYRLANTGYKVVLTNVTNFYFDLAYNTSFYEPGQYWGGYVNLEKPFRFIPFNYYRSQFDDSTGELVDPSRFTSMERLTPAGRANIVGIQAPLWSEKITTVERMEYLLLPKFFGLAERAWAADPQWANTGDGSKTDATYQHAWSVFLNTLGKRELPRIANYAGGFQYRVPTAGVVERDGKLHANVQFPGFTIRYTTDGSEPNAQSPVYEQPVTASETVAFRIFDAEGRGGRTVYWHTGLTR